MGEGRAERESPDEDSGHTVWHSVKMGGRYQLQATQLWQEPAFYGFNLFRVGSNSKVWFTSFLGTIHCPYYMMFRSWRPQGSCIEIPPGAILWWPKKDHLWCPLWEWVICLIPTLHISWYFLHRDTNTTSTVTPLSLETLQRSIFFSSPILSTHIASVLCPWHRLWEKQDKRNPQEALESWEERTQTRLIQNMSQTCV